MRTTLDFVNEFKCDKMFVRYPGTPDMIVHMIDADVFTDEFGRVIYYDTVIPHFINWFPAHSRYIHQGPAT